MLNALESPLTTPTRTGGATAWLSSVYQRSTIRGPAERLRFRRQSADVGGAASRNRSSSSIASTQGTESSTSDRAKVAKRFTTPRGTGLTLRRSAPTRKRIVPQGSTTENADAGRSWMRSVVSATRAAQQQAACVSTTTIRRVSSAVCYAMTATLHLGIFEIIQRVLMPWLSTRVRAVGGV